MNKVLVDDKFGKRTVWVMTTCPNHKARTEQPRPKEATLPQHRLTINGKPYASIVDAALLFGISTYEMTKRINSKLLRWARWERVRGKGGNFKGK